MSAVPAASYLTEFASDREGSASPAFVPFGRRESVSRSAASAETAARTIEAARASGFASGEAAAKAVLEARHAEDRETWARKLEAERQAWVRAEGEMLAQRLAAGLAEIETRVAQATARVLEPFLRAELRRQVIADLQAQLETLLARDAGISVTIAGPADLLEQLRERLAGRLAGNAGEVTYLPNGEPDVRIIAGRTILETRLGAWAARIAEAVA
jgi:hypothetical protein